MCGISGIVSKNVNYDEISSMNLALKHRGPDAEQVWNDENCFLAHTRLSIIDLSATANQPMHSHCDRYVIAYNGEVYNFRELAKQYNLTLKTSSDTEVILQTFIKLGKDFVKLLNGMFAIAIWDKQNKELFLFRDRIGIKPLYYYFDDTFFAFASELKALINLKSIKSKLSVDQTAVASYLHYGFIPQPLSIYEQIKKLPQAHFAIFSKQDFQIHRYWNVSEQDNSGKITSEEAALTKLENLIDSSVNYCLISDVPFGSFLSGGIDSSLVSAVAQKHLSGKLNTFSIGFEESIYDESVYAKRVADFLKTNHKEYILKEEDALNLIPNLMSIYDEPFADSSALPTLLVSKIAKQNVSMVLSGDGGDELFMGYGSNIWAKRLDNQSLFVLRKLIKKILENSNLRNQRVARLFDFNKTTNLTSHIFSQEQYLYNNKEVENILRIKAALPSAFSDFKLTCKKTFTSSEVQSIFDLLVYLPDDLLVKVDRASMHHSLEVRVPLLDYRVVEFTYLLSEKLKIKNSVQKYLLKKLLYKHVPAEYFNRPKKGFSIPLKKWMNQELNVWVNTMLDNPKLQTLFNIDVSKIESVESWRKGNDIHYNRVWQIAILSSWIEQQMK